MDAGTNPFVWVLAVVGCFMKFLEPTSWGLTKVSTQSEIDSVHQVRHWVVFLGCQTYHTVDGQNPAPPRMMIIPLFIGF